MDDSVITSWRVLLRARAADAYSRLSETDRTRLERTISKQFYMSSGGRFPPALGKYGLMKEDIVNLLIVQNSYCDIRGCDLSSPSVLRWGVDHCHEKWKVRGLVCQSCNTGARSAEALIQTALYMVRHGDLTVLDLEALLLQAKEVKQNGKV